jgi:hypothetical protein
MKTKLALNAMTRRIWTISLTLMLAFPAFALQSNKVSVSMGIHLFSWTFDKTVTYGFFADGQPWIVVPKDSIVKLTAVSPTRLNAQAVYHQYTGVAVTADINITVVNPPVGTYYNNGAGQILTRKAFGWDSRGAIRYATPTDNNYDPALGWDGVTPKQIFAGDIVTTGKSLLTKPTVLKTVETILDAFAVLTVLDTIPPSDAFRPGVIRRADRKVKPEFFRVSQLINMDPYLIAQPKTSIAGTAITAVYTKFSYARMQRLCKGPSLLLEGLNNGRSFHALYNDEDQNDKSVVQNNTYGADVAAAIGDLGVGSLAKWLTVAQRLDCRKRFIQRAIDTYESLLAGVVLTHNGGHLPGYGALMTIAGKMLNCQGMTDMNKSVNGREPLYYMSDYAQIIYIERPDIELPNTPAKGSLTRTSVLTTSAALQNLTIPVQAVGTSNITVSDNFAWPIYRGAREVTNLKLKIVSGPGAGDNYYVVNGIGGYYDADQSGLIAPSLGEAAPNVKGGVLYINGTWKNGTPDATSVFKAFVVVPAETPCFAFKSGGVNSTGVFDDNFTLSPLTDYGSINIGAYISYLSVMYAIGAQDSYTSMFDEWMISILKKKGYGPVIFNATSSRQIFTSTGESPFLSGIWKEQVLDKVGLTNFESIPSTMLLEAPVSDLIDGIPSVVSEGRNSLRLLAKDGHLTVESNSTIKKIELFGIDGRQITSQIINSTRKDLMIPQGVTRLIIRTTFDKSVITRKINIGK